MTDHRARGSRGAEIGQGRHTLDERNELAWSLRSSDSLRAAEIAEQILEGCSLSQRDAQIVRARGLAMRTLAECLWRRGELDEAEAACIEAHELCEQVGERRGAIHCLQTQGVLAFKRGRADEALRLLRHSLAQCVEQDLPLDRAISHNHIGSISMYRGEVVNAITHHEQALALRREHQDRAGEAISLLNIGCAYMASSVADLPKALEHLRAGLIVAQDVGEETAEAMILNNLGVVYEILKDYRSSLNVHTRSLQIKEARGDVEGMVFSLCNIGLANQYLGELETAREVLERALELARERLASMPDMEAHSLIQLGGVYTDLGLTHEALRMLARARFLFERSDNKESISRVLTAQVHLAMQHPEIIGDDEAIALGEELTAFAEANGYGRSAVTGYGYLAELHERAGNWKLALEAFKRYNELEIRQRSEAAELHIRQLKVELELDHARVEAKLAREREEALREALDRQQVLLDTVQEQARELERLVRQDPLTGLFNRRYLEESLQHEFARAKRYKRRLAVIMLDLDHFKPVNDLLGHAAGDEALCTIAKLITRQSRPADIIGRWGGDEFLIILPETGAHAAQQWAERIREAIAAAQIGAQLAHPVTACLGICSDTSLPTPADMIAAADAALYAAKRAGKNRVESA